MLRRFLAGLFLALFAFPAFAQVSVTQWRAYIIYNDQWSGWHETRSAAAAEALALYEARQTQLNQSCIANVQQGIEYSDFRFGTYHADGYPLNALRTYRSGNQNTSCSWSSGTTQGPHIINYQSQQTQISCPTGNNLTRTFHLGWCTGTDGPCDVTTTPPLLYCQGSCLYQLTTADNCESDTNLDDSGNRKLYCDGIYTGTGSVCDLPNIPPDPGTPPGSGGDGDGTGGGDGGDGDGGSGGDGDGNGGDPGGDDGGDGDGDGDGDSDGDGDGSDGGTSGGGGTGTGGTGGGGGGSGGSGSGDGGSEPMDWGTFSGDMTGDVAAVEQDIKDGIQSILAENITPDLRWTWTFQFPTGCSAYALAFPMTNITLDVCQWQPMFHDLMGMIWAAVAIFGLLSIFRWATLAG